MTETNEALSERELEILRLVATGAANKEIARQLLISPNTVKVHLRNIFSKIGVTSRTEATLYAIQIGLIHPGGQAPVVNEGDDGFDDLKTVEAGHQPHSGANGASANSAGPAATQATWRPTPTQLALIALVILLLISSGLLINRWLNPAITPVQSPPLVISVTSTPSPRWATKEALPAPRKGMGAVEYNNAFYLVGGETTEGVDGSLLRYLPETNAWQNLASKPTPVSDVQAALLGEKIYVPGGRMADGKDSAAFEVYDPRQDTWEQLAPLPVPMSGYALAAYEGRLFLFGGKSGEQYLNSVYEYQPDQNRWEKRAPMKQIAAYAGAAVIGNRIYIIGGYNGENALDEMVAYHPARDRDNENPWDSFTPLPSGRYAVAVTTLSNFIYIAGGIGLNQAPAAPQTLQYLPQTDRWNIFDLPADTLGAYGAMLPLEGYLHFIGGSDDQTLLAIHQSYQALFFNSIPLIQNNK